MPLPDSGWNQLVLENVQLRAELTEVMFDRDQWREALRRRDIDLATERQRVAGLVDTWRDIEMMTWDWYPSSIRGIARQKMIRLCDATGFIPDIDKPAAATAGREKE